MRNANYGFLTDRGRKEALEWFTKRDQCFLYFLYSALQWFFFIKGTNTKSMWTYNTPKVLCSRDFFWNFTSQSRVIFISLSLLNLDFQSFLFHFCHCLCRFQGERLCYCSENSKWICFFFLQEESVSVLNLRGEDDVSCSPTTQVCGEVLSSEMEWDNSRQVSNHI